MLSILTVAAFAAFRILRARQLASPDPYSNPFTTVSTAVSIPFAVLWLTTLCSIWMLRRDVTRSVAVLSWTVVSRGGGYIIAFLIQMVLFLFP